MGDVTERVLIDSDSNDIDNKTLDLKLKSLPSPNLPNPNNSNNKHILEKLKSIHAEVKFIGIKECKTNILLNIKNKADICFST